MIPDMSSTESKPKKDSEASLKIPDQKDANQNGEATQKFVDMAKQSEGFQVQRKTTFKRSEITMSTAKRQETEQSKLEKENEFDCDTKIEILKDQVALNSERKVST